ncbi:MAG: GMP/IMP nucleotidase [Gammaproteobacteria bacterium]|nr:GMP/IMP nucleotidase [Gammaproteobacteria bacterium]
MFDWQTIDCIFLDMDGTLLDLHFDDHFWQDFLPEAYASHHQLTIEQASRELAPKFEATKGTLDWYCVDYWSRELGLNVAELKNQVAHLIAIHDGVLEFLQRMRAQGKRLVLMTNAHPKVVALKMQHTGLQSQFDAIITSHQVGLPKENVEFWDRLQQHEPYDIQRTLFADDTLSVLQSAKRAGFTHLLHIGKPSSKRVTQLNPDFFSVPGFAQLLAELPDTENGISAAR